MTRFEIVEAKRHHCGPMSRALRRDHLSAMLAIGADVHRELRDCFDQSSFRKAWLIDGQIGALGGVLGTLANGDGMIWLAIAELAMRYPVAMIREARKQLAGLMRLKRGLVTTVLEGDPASLRFAIAVGFHDPDANWSGPAETRLGRRLLAREIVSNVDRRIPAGSGFAIPLSYRAEAA